MVRFLEPQADVYAGNGRVFKFVMDSNNAEMKNLLFSRLVVAPPAQASTNDEANEGADGGDR